MMRFSTQHLASVFAEEGKYDNFRDIASNLIRKNAIYELDDNGNERQVSRRQANAAIRKVFMEICGLSEDDLKSRKKRERAEKLHGAEIFEVIEDDIEFRVNEGYQNTEWFNTFVEERNAALGDSFEFRTEDSSLFIVCDYSGDNHDITMQQLAGGQTETIKAVPHTIKIGKDIDLIILGRVDYDKWIDKIAESFVQSTQAEVCTALYGASAKLPSDTRFKKSGTLSSSTKANFDELIENVSAANGSDVMIVGTKVALKKITALADVDWATPEQKEDIATLGRLGGYEGTTLMEVPQRLRVGTLAAGNIDKLIPNNKLLILPVVEDKFVKFVTEGETEIFEVTEKAELVDDFQTYEVSRRYGTGVILGNYFGEWTLQ